MSKFRKRIEELKKTNPLFKDVEIKTYNNNLDAIGDYLKEKYKNKFEELNESNNNSEESHKQVD